VQILPERIKFDRKTQPLQAQMTHTNLLRAEIDSPLQKSIVALLKKEHTWDRTSIKPYTSGFVNNHLTDVQHQFSSKILGT
jgi:hypothetical protein